MSDLRQTALTRTRYGHRIAPLYDLMETLPERHFAPWREMLWAQVPAGKILEVGVGMGKNFPYHPDNSTVIGIDLSEAILTRARRKAESLGHPLWSQYQSAHDPKRAASRSTDRGDQRSGPTEGCQIDCGQAK